MSQNALPSVGTRLMIGDGAQPEVFTLVAEATAITPMGGSTESLDASDLSSTWRVKKPGMLDAGQLQITVHLIPGALGAHTGLMTDWAERTERNIRVMWPDDAETVWQLRGFISAVSPTVQMNSTIQCSFTFELTGQPDFDAVP